MSCINVSLTQCRTEEGYRMIVKKSLYSHQVGMYRSAYKDGKCE